MRCRVVVPAAAAALLAAAPALATPTCPGADRSTCGGRIIPEPSMSAGFLTYDEWTGAMQQLAKEHPDRVRFERIGKTAGNLPVYAATVTDFADPRPLSDRTGLYFNGDIHGDERDGTEGFARVVEDLAETKDAATIAKLRREVLVFTDANPDGWHSGDVPPGGSGYTRQNGAGHDLNREWPVLGFQNPDTFPFADPEVQSIVRAHGNGLHRDQHIPFAYAFDVHGSATPETPPNAQLMLDVLLSAGQLSLTRAMEQAQWAQGYMDRLSATSNDNVLATFATSTGQQVYRVGDWDTSWDIYGYLVSGGFADWMGETTTGFGSNVAATIELFINGEPGQENTFGGYNQEVEAANVHSMRVAVASAMDLGATPQHAVLSLPGPVGWIPNRFSLPATPKPPAGGPPARTAPATTNDFFTDALGDAPLRRLDAHALGSLGDLHAIVLAQDPYLDQPAVLSALKSYVQAGGTLVLTDGALQALGPLGVVPASAVASQKQYAGYLDPASGDDPLTRGARPLSRQTYEPVPIGYKIDNSFSSATSVNTSPVWTVDQKAWEAAGGHTSATTGSGRTSLGEVRLGSGRVRIVGALLPDPTAQFNHPFGVGSYALTYWGYRVFANLLDGTERLAAGAPPAAESPAQPAARTCASRRSIRVTLPRGVRRATVRVGTRVRHVRVRDRRVLVDLRGLPRGRYRVTIRTGGRVLRRTYLTCTRRR